MLLAAGPGRTIASSGLAKREDERVLWRALATSVKLDEQLGGGGSVQVAVASTVVEKGRGRASRGEIRRWSLWARRLER